MNVAQNISVGSRLRYESSDNHKVKTLLKKVQLLDSGDKYPFTLSGGMRQRVAIARTLYEDKPIVLMDEPFSALDAVTRSNMQELAANLLADKTVLLITHDPLEAARLCNIILVLKNQPATLLEPILMNDTSPKERSNYDLVNIETELMHILKAC